MQNKFPIFNKLITRFAPVLEVPICSSLTGQQLSRNIFSFSSVQEKTLTIKTEMVRAKIRTGVGAFFSWCERSAIFFLQSVKCAELALESAEKK